MKLQRAFDRYGINSFSFSILQECSPDNLRRLEIHWINQKDAVKTGYNCYADGSSLTRVCEETRERISNGLKRSEKFHQTMRSDEYRQKV